MIDTIAPFLEFALLAFFGLMLFVPAFLIRKISKLENLWIRPLLWLIAFLVWPLWTLVGAPSELRSSIFPDVFFDLAKTSLMASAILFLPWCLLAFARSRRQTEVNVNNG